MTNIRHSTDFRRAAGATAAVALAGAAAVHVLWASGSSWPAQDYDDLANLVVGRGPFPNRLLTAVVAALLMTASTIAVAASRPAPAQSWVVRIGSKTMAAALLMRGVGGLAGTALGVGQASEPFRRWDRRLYSPLCISLGACVAIGGRR